MSIKRFAVSLSLLFLLIAPLQALAETPYSEADVLLRGRLYYSYLNQFFGNIVSEYSDSSEVTLTGAVGFSETDFVTQEDFDAKAKQGKVNGPTIYIEYVVTDTAGNSTTYYANDLLPVGGHLKGGLAKNNYTTALKNFSDPNSGAELLGPNFAKDSLNYKVRLNLDDYAASGYAATKTQVDAKRAEKLSTVTESPSRYYPNLEKLLVTRSSNTEINEIIICVKGTYTDDELQTISYTDDSKIQYWMDYYTMNMKNQRLRVKKAYSVLGDLTVIGNSGEYNKMALIANGRNPDYTEIAPGMYQNANGWIVFRVDLNDYTAKGYVY